MRGKSQVRRADLAALARSLEATEEEELGCGGCYERLGRFVEGELGGLDAAAAMPLVRAHLEGCADCREEYEALLRALEAGGLRRPAREAWAAAARRLFFGSDQGG